MTKKNVRVATSTTNIEDHEKLIEAINGLCEATYTAEFLKGVFRGMDSINLSGPEIWGLASVIESLGARLDDVMSKLIEIEGACEND